MKLLSRRLYSTFISLMLLVLSVPVALALDISIDNEFFYPGVSAKTLIVKNPSDSPIAVEVSIASRSYSRDGVEDFSETYPGMLAIPGQMIIGANSEQIVTLQKVRAGPGDIELPLRLIVETVPIDMGGSDSDVQTSNGGLLLVYRVVRSLYLNPRNVQSNITISEITQDDPEFLKLTLQNSGTAHQVMYSFDVVLNDGYSVSVKIEDLRGGVNMLPGDVRDIVIPLPENWPANGWNGAKLQNIIF